MNYVALEQSLILPGFNFNFSGGIPMNDFIFSGGELMFVMCDRKTWERFGFEN